MWSFGSWWRSASVRITPVTIVSAATTVDAPTRSPASVAPITTATSGLTYACVLTIEAGTTRISQTYAVNATNEPKTMRYARAATDAPVGRERVRHSPAAPLAAANQTQPAISWSAVASRTSLGHGPG